MFQVPDLKRMLKERGLPTSGNKAELILRLQPIGQENGAGEWAHETTSILSNSSFMELCYHVCGTGFIKLICLCFVTF